MAANEPRPALAVRPRQGGLTILAAALHGARDAVGEKPPERPTVDARRERGQRAKGQAGEQQQPGPFDRRLPVLAPHAPDGTGRCVTGGAHLRQVRKLPRMDCREPPGHGLPGTPGARTAGTSRAHGPPGAPGFCRGVQSFRSLTPKTLDTSQLCHHAAIPPALSRDDRSGSPIPRHDEPPIPRLNELRSPPTGRSCPRPRRNGPPSGGKRTLSGGANCPAADATLRSSHKSRPGDPIDSDALAQRAERNRRRRGSRRR